MFRILLNTKTRKKNKNRVSADNNSPGKLYLRNDDGDTEVFKNDFYTDLDEKIIPDEKTTFQAIVRDGMMYVVGGSYIVSDIESISDDVLLLKSGSLVTMGTPDDLKKTLTARCGMYRASAQTQSATFPNTHARTWSKRTDNSRCISFRTSAPPKMRCLSHPI